MNRRSLVVPAVLTLVATLAIAGWAFAAPADQSEAPVWEDSSSEPEAETIALPEATTPTQDLIQGILTVLKPIVEPLVELIPALDVLEPESQTVQAVQNDPASTPAITATAIGTAIALALFAPAIVLDQRRRDIVDLLAHQPGLHIAGIAEALGCSRNTAEHHIRVLQKQGQVRISKLGKFRCVSLWSTPAEEASRAALLRSELAEQVLECYQTNPTKSLHSVADQLGCALSTVQYHRRRLLDAGMI